MGEGWWVKDVYVFRGKEVIWLVAVIGDFLFRIRFIRIVGCLVY